VTFFTEKFLEALGAWQNGWAEDQARKDSLALALTKEASSLPLQYRSVSVPCFRKRFLHKGEMMDIVFGDSRDEGLASWTTDRTFAERMKGLVRPNAVSAAIFRHLPTDDEVIVNVPALWADPAFGPTVQAYSEQGGKFATALLNFRDTQSEVVLRVPLRGSEIVALSGTSSPFDDLCDRINIADHDRGKVFKHLLDSGYYPEEPQYIDPEAAQRVLSRAIQRVSAIMQNTLEATKGINSDCARQQPPAAD
jgi:hypothetical protein